MYNTCKCTELCSAAHMSWTTNMPNQQLHQSITSAVWTVIIDHDIAGLGKLRCIIC